MIKVSKLNSNTLVDLIKDLLNESRGLQLVQFSSASRLSLVLQQGFGTSYGKNTIICDVKSTVLSQNELLNKAANDSNTLFNEWLAQEYIVVFPQYLTSSQIEEFKTRISQRHRTKVEIIDLKKIEDILAKQPNLIEKYSAKISTWFEVYSHLADLLIEYYSNQVNQESNIARVIFDKLEGTNFAEINSGRLFRQDFILKEKGLDPIQIFSSFSYAGIKSEKRIEIINSLLKEFESDKKVTELTTFEGCPYPIITKIIQFRGWDQQNEIWKVFNNIYNNGFNGLQEEHFEMLKKWNGLDITSFTLFLFWFNSEDFLPLDKNTVGFLKTYNFIEERPRNYQQYANLCMDKMGLRAIGEYNTSDTFRAIVKDAYNFYDKSYQGEILSGSTASVITRTIGKETTYQELEKIAKKERIEQFKGFQIIGIRPLIKENRRNENDKQKHLKNLKEGMLYKFYTAFEFEKSNDNRIKYDQEKEVRLYNHISSDEQGNERQLNISISSIVGKNGSGKSTIADFLYLIINKIAFKKKIKSTEKLINEEVYADLFVKADKLYKISVGRSIRINEYFFDDEKSCYVIQSKIPIDKFDLERFCYSVVINYSLYGLNSNYIGEWINPLFHKNDSYQVPLVLNPKRDEGDIDVNIEEGLAKSRLLSNILEPDLIDFEAKIIPDLVSGSKPKTLILTLDTEKLKRKKTQFRKTYSTIQKLQIDLVFNSLNIHSNLNLELIENIKEYIFFKVVAIADHYPKFSEYKDLPHWIMGDLVKLRKYLDLLNEETSHICFKLRQAINFLKYATYQIGQQSILEVSEKIRNIKDESGIKTIELIPPSLFKTNLIFNHGGTFDELSSGEKQQIFSINTIAYHVYNIESVMFHEDSYKYNSVNILFDEVELYFHPEMQRTYIKRLHERLISLNLNDINNINIIFITHSPFILSDLPSQNILRLKEGNPVSDQTQTFGANIHQLLHNDFFLENGFIGEFAKFKIEEVVDFLRLKKWNLDEEMIKARIATEENEIQKTDLKIQLEILKLEKTRIKTVNDSLDIDKCQNIIDLVGEPLIKDNLNQLITELKILIQENL